MKKHIERQTNHTHNEKEVQILCFQLFLNIYLFGSKFRRQIRIHYFVLSVQIHMTETESAYVDGQLLTINSKSITFLVHLFSFEVHLDDRKTQSKQNFYDLS